MSKVKGWISLYRSVRHNWIYTSEPFDRFHAFVDLIFRAQYEDTKILIQGQLIELKKGQLLVGIGTLAEAWEWSPNKVKRFLNLLENDGIISKNGLPYGTVITVENYSKYQSVKNADEPPLEPTGEPSHGLSLEPPLEPTGEPHINNINNINNITNKQYIRVGVFNNVHLTEDEIQSLQDNMTGWREWIEDLSAYMKSSGKIYDDHYATLWKWYRDDPKRHEKSERYDGIQLGRDI